jgi:undecaprenyl diphosphate synthase
VTPTQPEPDSKLGEFQKERLPRHIAVIMDGNGRWAVDRGLPRIVGHRAGARGVRDIVTECARLGLEALTLYSFSVENWKRPEDEIEMLMGLYEEYLVAERAEMIENNIRFTQCGRREGLPARVLEELDETVRVTSHCTGLRLILALNYGSRTELTDATRAIAAKVLRGELALEDISHQTIQDHLYVPDVPDPDLLVRTAGEMRISNYLLWQISYAELHVTPVLWPDFKVDDLHTALRDFAARHRRFGGLDENDP